MELQQREQGSEGRVGRQQVHAGHDEPWGAGECSEVDVQ